MKSRKEVEDGQEEEVEDSVLPGQVLFPTQVEAKGSDLTYLEINEDSWGNMHIFSCSNAAL